MKKDLTETLVFVYGTLKTGYGNWNRLLNNRSEFISNAKSKDKMYMVDNGAFPYVSDELEHTEIQGEVFKVSPEVLQDLDHLKFELF